MKRAIGHELQKLPKLKRLSSHWSIVHLNVIGFVRKLSLKRLVRNKIFSHLSQMMTASQPLPKRLNTLVLYRSPCLTTVRQRILGGIRRKTFRPS